MTKILAISGGVDSMVMLDIFARQDYSSGDIRPQQNPTDAPDFPDQYSPDDIIVAHFNHGTRSSADDDLEFVKRTAHDHYHINQIVTQTAHLGANVSEERARAERYEFLRQVAASASAHNFAASSPIHTTNHADTPFAASIYTAHHLDDLVESIAINLLRGTGWRGLAVLDTPGVCRPFLEAEYLPKSLRNYAPFDKKALQKYAATFKIIYRQDPTNIEDYYLRNRVRTRLSESETYCGNTSNMNTNHICTTLSESADQAQNTNYKMRLYELWHQQKALKRQIDCLVKELIPRPHQPWQRSWFRNLDQNIAIELLRAGTLQAGISATRPQLDNFRQAILTYQPGTYFNLPNDHLIKIQKDTFII